MEMLSLADVRSEAVAYVFHGDAPGDIGEHVDATLALGVDGNPGKTGKLAGNDFDSRKVHGVFGEGLLNDAAVAVVANQAEPAGFGAETRHLGEIVSGHAAGMNFQAVGIDLFLGTEQTRNQGKEIDGAAADADDFSEGRHDDGSPF